MFVVLGIAALVALLAFVVWDRRRIQRAPVRPLSREALSKGWSPQPLLVWPFWAGLAFVAASLAVIELLAPSQPPFKGRWSTLEFALYSSLGTYGIALFWSAVGVALSVMAFFTWQARKATSGESPPNAL
jgi:hypothetical protein